jgi:hypothetical protein
MGFTPKFHMKAAAVSAEKREAIEMTFFNKIQSIFFVKYRLSPLTYNFLEIRILPRL